MKLQLALDRLSREKCKKVLAETESYIDYIEIGTGVIKEYGISIVSEIKEIYPEKIVVADMKTCDAGKYEAAQAFEAGADITTVMAFSADQTISDALEAASRYEKQIMVDLLGINLQQRLIELQSLGVELVSIHFGKDMQQNGELDISMLSQMKELQGMNTAVAGGISIKTLPKIIEMEPEIIIVGSAIAKAEYPLKVAIEMKGMLT